MKKVTSNILKLTVTVDFFQFIEIEFNATTKSTESHQVFKDKSQIMKKKNGIIFFPSPSFHFSIYLKFIYLKILFRSVL